MKTRKAVAKKFQLTATGKLKRNHPGKRHLLTKKTSKRKRQLGKPSLVSEAQVKVYKRLMCV
jgi:large subunit ribosomal protein L35